MPYRAAAARSSIGSPSKNSIVSTLRLDSSAINFRNDDRR